MKVSALIRQKSYEKVEFVLRRHWVTFVPVLLLFIFLMLVPVLLYYMITSLFPTVLAGPTLYPVSVILASVYYLSIYLFLFGQFIDFYLDVWIVTNDRIVDIEQFGLFSRTISELDLFRIQDVTTDVHGVFPTLFKYGNVVTKTASQNTDIIFKNVPDPNHVREELLRLSHIDRKYHYAQPTLEDHD